MLVRLFLRIAKDAAKTIDDMRAAAAGQKLK